LKYGHVEGDLDLRTTLKSYLRDTRCIVTSVENIFITRGSQMGLYLILASLIKSGDTCITSFPGYKVVDDTIRHLGGRVLHVEVDDEGLVTKKVEEFCKRRKISLLYITPHHHYPTTVTLSPVRRIELLQLAIKYNFYILEDDYAYDFHYSNNPVLPLASLNKSQHVIYIGSFSKCLAPSVRIGYFVAPVEVIEAANKLRRVIDRLGDPPLERALSEFIKSGDLQRHLKKVVKIYRHRRDNFCELLKTHLSDHVSFAKPEGGMSVWVIFKKGITLKTLPARLAREGYFIESDNIFDKKLNAIRIGFAALNEKEMDRFVAAIARIL
jgi:GntR family transcriptional regulator/MocR family aminotransferase